jgi:segregation and condensation protein A
MTETGSAEIVAFAADPERAADEPALIVDVEGFEGPLDLLLRLAREQKVDLAKISILALANQYLAFIEEARRLRLELAADYLVMAAWLAYLKSRLLLPEPPGGPGESAADLANALALRLQLGRDVFERGAPEPINEIKRPQWSATLYDLLTAYARERQKQALARVRLVTRKVWSLADARAILERLVEVATDWTAIDQYLIEYVVEPSMRATALASSLAASLEMAREGQLELHQDAAFAPLYMRRRSAPMPDGAAG